MGLTNSFSERFQKDLNLGRYRVGALFVLAQVEYPDPEAIATMYPEWVLDMQMEYQRPSRKQYGDQPTPEPTVNTKHYSTREKFVDWAPNLSYEPEDGGDLEVDPPTAVGATEYVGQLL